MRKQILIVEDNELNREILVGILSEEYQVLEAENGQEALDILHQSKDQIALILLDVMMPVMDGFTFLDRVRDDPELSLIPVIVTTQSDGEADEVAALAHGATDFVPKPYRPQVILHRVASLIKLRETAAMVNQFQYDRLTGLYSKELFYQKVRERLDEDPDREYTIVCANIENFKLFNDTYGREAGDRLLKEMADITRSIVGGTGLCGRLTGDRFLAFQERDRERQDRMNFGHFTEPQPTSLMRGVVMRWGIYEVVDRSLPVEQMCDRAMLAADSIKGQYNCFFALYDDTLRKKLLREQAVTDAMETALAEGQFTVYFQPKYSLNDDFMSGAEVLVRWNHPEWGFMSPGEFIPLFEKNGFISRLDQFVWEQACALLQRWKAQGLPLLPLSVNVSRVDVYQTDLPDRLLRLTERYGVDPANLHLEITESAYAENPGKIVSTVEKLRSLGFVIEMDDFGSGYSSLNMLGQITLDILKLDMGFIRNETAKPSEHSILNDVISMAHRMHLSVVAEGVETREQVNRLRALNCDYVQGFYFAKPMPEADYEALLRTWHRPAGHAPAREQQRRPGQQRLLVADEDPAYRKQVRALFEDRFRVQEAADGESVLRLLGDGDPNLVAAVILSMTLPDDGAAAVMSAMRQEPDYWPIPVLATIPSGDRACQLPTARLADDFLCKCHPMFDLQRRLAQLMEIASFRRRESALQDEANRDPLTGLLNRRGLQDAVSSFRKEDLPLTVCLFDLDDLKMVNDTYGHDMGDRMLSTFADLLCRRTRSGDVHCRYGGDEFLLVLKRLNDPGAAMKKCSEICEAFHDYLALEDLPAACSGGIVPCGGNEPFSAGAVERADQALYRAKRENKGGCCLWTEG